MYRLITKILPVGLIRLFQYNELVVKIIQQSFYKLFPFPKVVQMHITSDCNLSCEYCYSKHVQKEELDWMDVLGQARKLKVTCIEFMGGEPLLDSKLEEYISFCDRFNMKVKIYTNGTLLSEKWISFFNTLRNKPVLVLKFDRVDLLEHVLGEGAFDDISLAIKRCVASNIRVHGHVIVNKLNYKFIKQIIELTLEHKILLTTERYMPVTNSPIDIKLQLDQQQWNESLAQVNLYYKKISKHYQINAMIKGNTCSCYIDLLSIDIDGAVKPCPFSTQEQIIGTVRDSSLRDIWKRFVELRKEWMEVPDGCKKCKYKLLCHGGCKTHTFIQKRTYNAKDPLCNGTQIPTSIFSDQYLKSKAIDDRTK